MTDMIRSLIEMTGPPPSDRTPLRRHQCFKKNQLLVLHQSFRQDPHPSIDVLQQLAAQLTVSVEKVRVSLLFSIGSSRSELVCLSF